MGVRKQHGAIKDKWTTKRQGRTGIGTRKTWFCLLHHHVQVPWGFMEAELTLDTSSWRNTCACKTRWHCSLPGQGWESRMDFAGGKSAAVELPGWGGKPWWKLQFTTTPVQRGQLKFLGLLDKSWAPTCTHALCRSYTLIHQCLALKPLSCCSQGLVAIIRDCWVIAAESLLLPG